MNRLVGASILCLCCLSTIILVFRESCIQVIEKVQFATRRRHFDPNSSVFSNDADNFVNGSSVKETNSTLSLDFVCLQRNESTGMHLFTYTTDGVPLTLANGTPPFPPELRQHYKWAWWPIGKKSEEWMNDRQHYYVPNTTVLLVRIYGSNIAHCMSDLIFAFAPDIDQLWNTTPKTYIYVEQGANQAS